MKYLLSLIILINATACTSFWQQHPNNSIDELKSKRITKLAAFHNWKIQGRMMITQGKEGWHAGLIWQTFDDIYQIKLQGPFLQSGAILNGRKGKAVLIMDNNKHLSSANAESLVYNALNLHLPVHSLRYWIRGIPAPEKIEAITYDDKARITHLKQRGWTIDYLRYVNFKTLTMPVKIFIKNTHKAQSLRLAITYWETTTSEQAETWH